MSITGLIIQPRNVADTISAGWRWWIGEMAALVPQKSATITIHLADQAIRIVRRTREGNTEVGQISRDNVHSEYSRALMKRLKEKSSGNECVCILLPRHHVLRRTVHVPLSSGNNLSRILVYELERQSPIDPKQVYFDYRAQLPDKAAKTLSVVMRIARRSTIDQAITLCRSLGLDPGTVDFEGDEHGFDGSNIGLNSMSFQRSRGKRLSFLGLYIIVFFLALSLIFASYNREILLSNELDSEIASAKSEALVVERLRKDISETSERIVFPARQREQPLLGKILTDVTRATPDDTWIFSLELNRPEIHVRGYSAVASSLIELFDSARAFTNAQFRAPLTQAPKKGQERFDLSFKLNDGKR